MLRLAPTSLRLAALLSSLAVVMVALLAAAPAPDSEPRAAELIAIAGPLPPGAAERLARSTAFHGDFGTIAVVEADPAAVAALARRGLAAVALGPWPEDVDLVVTHAGHEDQDTQAAPAGRVLFATAQQELVAVPQGALGGLSCHRGALVRRAAWKPGAGFGAPLGPAPQAALATDPRITPMVAAVSSVNLLASVTSLSAFFTRRADSATALLAKDWIVAQASLIPGWTVSTHAIGGGFAPNVVAEKLGTVHPERIVVLGAHYDSINLAGAAFAAPGADDNASGSAGLLEAARVLAGGSFENTIRCVWFSAEEFGLVGSDAYAGLLDTQGAQVVAMLNMDMIAHLQAGDAFDLDFATNDTDPTLTQFCRDVTAAYVPSLPTVTGVLTSGSSDHASFAAHGFPAAFLFEDLTDFSMDLHTSADVLPTSANSFALAHDITQSFVASAATLAAPVDMTLAHVPLGDTSDSGGPYALSVQAHALAPDAVASVQAFYRINGGVQWSAALLPGNGPDLWVGSLPGGTPLATVEYWLLATDAAGHTQWLPEAFEPGGKTWKFTVATLGSIFTDGFEGPTDNGWTHVQTAVQDDWQRGAPQGKAGDPALAAQGFLVWGNDLGGSGWNGSYGANVDNRLESPAISCAGKTNVHLRFKRWLTVEDGEFDTASIAVNGTAVWQNPITPTGVGHTLDTEWTQQDLDVSSLANNNPSVKLRFRLQSDGGLEFGGWNVDDVRLVTETNGTASPLTSSALYLSAAAGGTLHFTLAAGPASGSRKYVLALSASGTSPGTPLGSVSVPLVFDALTTLGFDLIGSPVLPGGAGVLTPQGLGAAAFVAPPLPGLAGLVGLHLSFAFFTLGPIDFASNAVSVEYVP